MELNLLKTLGQIAGIGGLAIGMVILIFRDVIRKRVFPRLTQEQAFRLLRLILVLVWSVAILGIAAWVYTNQSSKPEPVRDNKTGASQPEAIAGLIKAARLQRDAGDYEGGWKLLQQALNLLPGSHEVQREQVQLAMTWLRNIHTLEPHTFTEYVNQILPALYEGAARESGSLAADIYAHIGWSNFLKYRDGDQHLDIEGQYKKALSLDPDNPYANVMWGHWILSKRGSLTDAQRHFTAALKTGRDKEFVRELQISALEWSERIEDEMEIIRLGNEMRKSGEELPLKIREGVVSHVYEWKLRDIFDQLPSILPPSENLATFNWFTRDLKIEPYSAGAIVLARLTEATGDYSNALSLYASYRNSHGYSYLEQASEGIVRCTKHLPKAK